MDQKTQYFQLSPELLLRGWEDIKYALVDSRDGRLVQILTSPAVDALELAWNGIPLNSPLMLPTYHAAFEFLLRKNCGIKQDHFIAPLSEQRMKNASCNYAAFLCWSITGRCNMKCRHCYVEAPDALYGELTLPECISIMDQMIDANLYSVVLTGGEPLVRADWQEFYAALKARRIAVQAIYTNGLLVTDRWLDEFEKLESRRIIFSLSFDGVGHHDWLRGRDGVERPVVDAIRRLVRRGYPVEIESVMYKDNLDSLPATCELLTELGIQKWKVAEVSDSRTWRTYAADHTASPEALNQGYVKLLERFQELGRPFQLQIDHRYMYDPRIRKAFAPAVQGGTELSLQQPVCMCMRLHPYLLPDGTLMPCMPLSNCGLDQEMPNLRNVTLPEVLSSKSEYFKFISLTVAELYQREECECATCEYRFQCCGGCRARAYTGGGLYGADPALCDYFRNGTRKLYEPFYDLP